MINSGQEAGGVIRAQVAEDAREVRRCGGRSKGPSKATKCGASPILGVSADSKGASSQQRRFSWLAQHMILLHRARVSSSLGYIQSLRVLRHAILS